MHPLYPAAQKLYRPILDAAYKILHTAGAGLPESYYQQALQHELRLQGCTAEREVSLTVVYKDEALQSNLRADIVVNNCFVIELKAVDSPIIPKYVSQILTYMATLGCPSGLIFNFGITKDPRYTPIILNGANTGFEEPADSIFEKGYRPQTPPHPDPTDRPPSMHPRFLQAYNTYPDILAAADEVQKILGPGRLQEIYHYALIRELTLRGHHVTHELRQTLTYQDASVETILRASILIDGCIVLSPVFFTGSFLSHPLSYIRSLTYMTHLNYPIGLVYNFGEARGERHKPLILEGANANRTEPPDSPFYRPLYCNRCTFRRH